MPASTDTENKSIPLAIQLHCVRIANLHETIRPSGLFGGQKPGTIVAIRPCKGDGKKTYLGMYLCSAPTAVYGKEVEPGVVELHMGNYTNPAIYVPELDEIVWGYGSWWGEIESEDKLREITDGDIANVWYVRALKQLQDRLKEPKLSDDGK